MKFQRLGFEFYALFVLVVALPATAIAVWLGQLLSYLGPPLSNLVTYRIVEAPTAMAIGGLLFWIYEMFIWRIPGIPYLHSRPDLNGRYEGNVESSYDGAKYPIVLEIEQTLLSVQVRVFTERSASASLIADIGKNDRGNDVLVYAYRNIPQTVTSDTDMRAHDGFAQLEVFPTEGRVRGKYFNDNRERPTYGVLSVERTSGVRKGHF